MKFSKNNSKHSLRYPKFDQPNKNSYLYKVITKSCYEDMLKNNYLYFNRVDQYEDDKRDSDRPDKDKNISQQVTFDKNKNVTLDDCYNRSRSKIYACCFSQKITEELWKTYGKEDYTKSVCLVIKSENLIRFTDDVISKKHEISDQHGNTFTIPLCYNHGLVTYCDYRNDQVTKKHLPNLVKFAFFKDKKKFSSEKEFRIILYPQYALLEHTIKGDKLKFPKGILLSPFKFSNLCAEIKNYSQREDILSDNKGY